MKSLVTVVILMLPGFIACKKSESVEERSCVAFELVNNTGQSVDPLMYINSCETDAGSLRTGTSAYLMGDERSLVHAEGLVWERLRELPLRQRKFVQSAVAELGVFRSSPTADGNSFSPLIMTNIDLLHVRYWDTTRVKHEVIVSMEGGLPENINATVVMNLTLEDNSQKVFNASFEEGLNLVVAKKIDMPASRVRTHWRFWKYKYQNG